MMNGMNEGNFSHLGQVFTWVSTEVLREMRDRVVTFRKTLRDVPVLAGLKVSNMKKKLIL